MPKLKIIAGDLDAGKHDVVGNILRVQNKTKLWSFDQINLSASVVSVELVTEQNKKAIGGTLIGGIAGMALLGPLGAVGGMLLGGNKKDVTFVVELSDGRRFMAQADSKLFVKMQGWTMKMA